jgi:CubicO group peptidase (beta-lactamase class C family)
MTSPVSASVVISDLTEARRAARADFLFHGFDHPSRGTFYKPPVEEEVPVSWKLRQVVSAGGQGSPARRRISRARAEGVWATFLNQTKVFFDELIPGQLREGHLAGAAVSVVNDGHMVFAKGYGYADREGRLLRAIPS